MSRLNPFNRALLRLAARIAGPAHAEWCAAMAAETDAAGQQAGLGWALGCLSAAIWANWRQYWRRSLFLLLSPVLALIVGFALSLPLVYAFQRDWIPGPVYAITVLAAQAGLAFAIGHSAPRGFPTIAMLYYFVGYVGLPLCLYWISTGQSPLVFLQPETQWLNMPRNWGLSITLAAFFLGGSLGYAQRPAKREA